MGIFESFVGLVCVIIIFAMGLFAGIGCQMGKYYAEATKMIAKMNELMGPATEMYKKMIDDFKSEM